MIDEVNGGQRVFQARVVDCQAVEARHIGKYLESQLGHDGVGAQAANQELAQIEAGRILDHFATDAKGSSHAINYFRAQDEIAQAAIAITARTGQVARDCSAKGSGVRQQRIARQVLPPLAQRRRQVSNRCARSDGHGVFRGLIFDDSA